VTGAAPAEPPTVPRRLRRLPWAAVAGHRVRVAERPLPRLLGLALIDRGRAGSGLLIPRCRSVHTFGMRFALDLVFLDRGGSVISQRRGVRPGHVAVERRAASVLEIPS
jgi:uncharacterized protein